jgi:catechol 2,3-dioxygenase-like lactoylglutathione lyase family enzyme
MARIDGRPVAFVYTRDRVRARDFYAGTLGLPLLSDDPFGMSFELGSGMLRLTEFADFVAGKHPVAGWEVPSISAAVAVLEAAGIAPRVYEGMGQDDRGIWTSPDGAARIAGFNDPDDNLLSLSETRWRD